MTEPGCSMCSDAGADRPEGPEEVLGAMYQLHSSLCQCRETHCSS